MQNHNSYAHELNYAVISVYLICSIIEFNSIGMVRLAVLRAVSLTLKRSFIRSFVMHSIIIESNAVCNWMKLIKCIWCDGMEKAAPFHMVCFCCCFCNIDAIEFSMSFFSWSQVQLMRIDKENKNLCVSVEKLQEIPTQKRKPMILLWFLWWGKKTKRTYFAMKHTYLSASIWSCTSAPPKWR